MWCQWTLVFLPGSNACIPASGPVYIVQRQRGWGHAERTFLCRDATQTHCWAEWGNTA